MATATSTFVSLKNIFFVTDLAQASRVAAPYVIALASRYKSKVTLVHALGAIPFTPIPYEPVPPLDTRPRLLVLPQMEELRKEFVANGIETEIALKDGELTEVLNDELKHVHPDLLVVGSHAHGSLHRLLMGSHAEEVVRHVPCGVLMIGPLATGAPRWRHRIARIVLATNFEEGSEHALSYIGPLAAEHGSELTMLHVVDEPAGVPLDSAEWATHESNKRLKQLAAKNRLWKEPRLESRVGHPEQEITEFANREDADLIVLGRRKGGILAEHKPSTKVAWVAAHARCPVLTIC